MPQQFAASYRVYAEDVDYGGVVYHARYLHFLERARSDWIRRFGLEREELLLDNLIFVVVELRIKYLRPARLDDLLEVTVAVAARRPLSLWLEQKVLRSRKDELLAEARVRLAALHADEFSLRPIPGALTPDR